MKRMQPSLLAALMLACGFGSPRDLDAQARDHGTLRVVLAEKVLAVRLARMKTHDAAAKLFQTRADSARGRIANLEKLRDQLDKQVAIMKPLSSKGSIALQEMQEMEAKLIQANLALDAPRAVIAEATAELQLIAARKNVLLAEIEESRAGIEFLRMQITPK